MAGKVLEHRAHSAVVEALHRRRHQLRRGVEISGIGPVADDGVLRVGPHVGHRGQIGVEAAAGQVGADGIGVVIGSLGALVLVVQHGPHPGGAHSAHEPGHPSPLLITGEDEGDLGIALAVAQHLLELALAEHIGPAVQNPADGIALQPRLGGRTRLGGGAHPGDILRGHDDKLADLFIPAHLGRHLRRQSRRPLLHRGGGRWGRLRRGGGGGHRGGRGRGLDGGGRGGALRRRGRTAGAQQPPGNPPGGHCDQDQNDQGDFASRGLGRSFSFHRPTPYSSNSHTNPMPSAMVGTAETGSLRWSFQHQPPTALMFHSMMYHSSVPS